jgi:hypothetical protein
VTGRNHPGIHLLLTRQPDTRDHARAHVDQGAIRAGHVCVGIEHGLPCPALCAPHGLPDERVGYAALKDFSGQVAPVLAAQRTLDRDPRCSQRLNASGDVLAASLAADHEVAPALRTPKHGKQYSE